VLPGDITDTAVATKPVDDTVAAFGGIDTVASN
jgi:hypothetical protein